MHLLDMILDRRYRLTAAMGLLGVIVSLPVMAENDPEAPEVPAAMSLDVTAVRQCMQANLPTKSSEQQVVLKATDRAGSERELNAKIYWRKDDDARVQANVKISQPLDLAGSSYLLLERESRDDLFMYLPATQRSKRIVGSMMSQPLWGTDFSYEDIKRVQGVLDDGDVVRLEDHKLDEREVFQLKLTPAAKEESPYSYMLLSVDQETCVMSQIEFYAEQKKPAKRLTVDPTAFKKAEGRWYPAVMKMTDIKDGSYTTLEISTIEFDKDLPSRLFSTNSFYRGN